VDAAASGAQVFAGQALPVSEKTACRRTMLSVRQNCVVLASVADVKSAEVSSSPTGLRCAFNPPMTVTKRIRRRGERGISRKTIAQGMSDCLR
jgi:hypothetical protein